jgi:hypothetical protein
MCWGLFSFIVYRSGGVIVGIEVFRREVDVYKRLLLYSSFYYQVTSLGSPCWWWLPKKEVLKINTLNLPF